MASHDPGRPDRPSNPSNEELRAWLRKAAAELRQIAERNPARASEAMTMAQRLEALAAAPDRQR